MSTPWWASALQIAARLPGSSRTVVRIRHRAVVAAVALSDADPDAEVAPAVPPGAGSEGAVLGGGGAWLWRRAHQVWNAVVTRSAMAGR